MPHGHQLVATIWLACYDTTVAISIVWMHVTRRLLLIPSAPSRKVYRIRKTPSRQPAPRMVCRILPCWEQGEIRVPPPFRGDRDQVFFLGTRRSVVRAGPFDPDVIRSREARRAADRQAQIARLHCGTQLSFNPAVGARHRVPGIAEVEVEPVDPAVHVLVAVDVD